MIKEIRKPDSTEVGGQKDVITFFNSKPAPIYYSDIASELDMDLEIVAGSIKTG